MVKTIEYKLRYYHYSEDCAFEELEDWLTMIKELKPEADVSYVSSKLDYGMVVVSWDEDNG